MTRVLVTGGGGFIGTHWCRTLAAAGYSGVILDSFPQSAPAPDGWDYVYGDVRDAALLDTLLSSCERVVHLAAAHHDAGIPEHTYADVNVRGTQTLLDAMARHERTDLIFTSTVAVYGDSPGANEQTTPAPLTPYGRTKLDAERVITEWVAEDPRRRAVILRPAVVVGPGHFANMYSLMKQIESGFFVHVGSAQNIKSLSSAATVIGAGEFLRTKGSGQLQTANVVSEPQMSSAAIIELMSQALNKRPPKLAIPLGAALFAASAIEVGTRLVGRKTAITRARVKKLFDAETRFEASVLAASGFSGGDTTTAALRATAAWFLETGRNQTRQVRLPLAEPVIRARTSTDPVPTGARA